MKLKRLGWIGFSDGAPHMEWVTDNYSELARPHLAAQIFSRQKDARRRFEDVRPVFVERARRQGSGRGR